MLVRMFEGCAVLFAIECVGFVCICGPSMLNRITSLPFHYRLVCGLDAQPYVE